MLAWRDSDCRFPAEAGPGASRLPRRAVGKATGMTADSLRSSAEVLAPERPARRLVDGRDDLRGHRFDLRLGQGALRRLQHDGKGDRLAALAEYCPFELVEDGDVRDQGLVCAL